jgi:hypothetical protein
LFVIVSYDNLPFILVILAILVILLCELSSPVVDFTQLLKLLSLNNFIVVS